VDNSVYTLDEKTLLVRQPFTLEDLLLIKQPLPPPAEGDASLPYEVSNLRNYSLAVSGDVFRWIIEYGSEETLKRVPNGAYTRLSLTDDTADVDMWSSLCTYVAR